VKKQKPIAEGAKDTQGDRKLAWGSTFKAKNQPSQKG